MWKKRLLGSFKTTALHRLVRDFGIQGQVWYLIVSIPDLCTLTYFHKKEHSIMSYIDIGGGGGGGYWAETTHQIRPKRPTLKSGRNNPGRNDPAETTHGRNDSCPKRTTAETTRNLRILRLISIKRKKKEKKKNFLKFLTI